MDDELYELEQEVFASGTWNGDKYSEEDLDNMVENFKLFGSQVKVPLKLGHDDGQKFVQNDGLPAIGWVKDLKKNGSKLVAKIVGIPQKVKNLIDKNAFTRFSSEIIWNFKNSGNIHKRVLSAVALLGADMPAVTSISDMNNLYSNDLELTGELHAYHIIHLDNKEEAMELKELEQKLADEQESKKKLSADLEAMIAQKQELENKLKAQEFEAHKVKVYSFIDENIKEGKLIPALREKFAALALAKDEEGQKVHTYTEKEENKTVKFADSFELLKSIVADMPKALDQKEYTKKEEKEERIKTDSTDTVMVEGRKYYTDETLHKAALKIMEDKKITDYREALHIANASKEV
jgi:hypothetical protein